MKEFNMEIAELVLEYLTILISSWPLLIFLLIIIFKEKLRPLYKILLERLKKDTITTPYGSLIPSKGISQVTSTQKASDLLLKTVGFSTSDDSDEIVIAIGQLPGIDPYGIIGTADALAMAQLQSLLLKVEAMTVKSVVINQEYTSIHDFYRENKNIISIGGPFANKITREVLGANPVSFKFDGGIIDSKNSVKYETKWNPEDKSLITHGIIDCFPNPSHSQGRIIVIAGQSAIGGWGAAKAFSNLEGDKILSTMAHKVYFEVLLEIYFKEDRIQDYHILEGRPLDIGEKQESIS